MNREDFPVVLAPDLYRKTVESYIEELDTAITRSCKNLILMSLGPRCVEKTVLSVVPTER